MFNLSCSITNQQLLKRTSAIKVATVKITDEMETIPQNLHFIAKMNGTQMEGTGKSMKNALHVQWYGKRYLLS